MFGLRRRVAHPNLLELWNFNIKTSFPSTKLEYIELLPSENKFLVKITSLSGGVAKIFDPLRAENVLSPHIPSSPPRLHSGLKAYFRWTKIRFKKMFEKITMFNLQS